MNWHLLATIVLAGLAIGSALLVILHRNPVVSALALAFNLIAIAGFYLVLNAQFIALLQVIVYAGAIMVLILFVVMLLNLQDEMGPAGGGGLQRWIAPALALVLAGLIGRAVLVSPLGTPDGSYPADFGTASSVGRELFTRFYYPFEAISLLLVGAMIGAVILAKRRL